MKVLKVFKSLITNVFVKSFNKKLRVMDSRKTLEYIIKNKVSIGRFGDGEISLIDGKDLKFQKSDEKLRRELIRIKTNEKFLTCIPNIFERKSFNKNIVTKEEFSFWSKHKLLYEYKWRKLFKNQLLGDAFISRYYMRYNDKSQTKSYIELLKKLWNNRNVIIVEGENTKVGCENDLLDNTKSIRRIICKGENAFENYDNIYSAVKEFYNEDDLILLSLGPTATILAYNLSKVGIQSLDMGHFDIEYEWFLANLTKKAAVKNKHVNECDSFGHNVSKDDKYSKQIIKKIL